PAEFLAASSIGQVIAELTRLGKLPAQEPEAFVLVAAADHCLGAAYRGECPGVDPDALMHWRVAQRAQFQGRAAGQILDDIERARDLLSDPDTVELAPGIRVVDVRGYCVVTHDCGHKELQHEDYTT